MRTALAVLATLTLATVGHAATFEQKFYKAIAKNAVSIDELLQKGKIKGLCVCQEDALVQQVGIQVFVLNNPGTADRIACFVPSFTPEGALDTQASTQFCLTWVPTVK